MFICATLDWWPSNKCDYGHCQWAGAGLLEAPLDDERLLRAMRYLAPLTLRVGGTSQDNVTYARFGGAAEQTDCPPFSPAPPQPSARFSGGCLLPARIDSLLSLGGDARARLVLSINAVVGRGNASRGLRPEEDAWDPAQALALLRHVAARAAASPAASPLWGCLLYTSPSPRD